MLFVVVVDVGGKRKKDCMKRRLKYFNSNL
jgi:hypothetical protein